MKKVHLLPKLLFEEITRRGEAAIKGKETDHDPAEYVLTYDRCEGRILCDPRIPMSLFENNNGQEIEFTGFACESTIEEMEERMAQKSYAHGTVLHLLSIAINFSLLGVVNTIIVMGSQVVINARTYCIYFGGIGTQTQAIYRHIGLWPSGKTRVDYPENCMFLAVKKQS